ncbi:hypothetical protein WJX84_009050 [Apatococcus fuscideae]|uniref:Phosphatidic acid phosphatase type 2/haloperoxidase domain-containing protein n=1 Tax=Apatococcus fuscideae TaxID=2026836 RepID=A0AAW1SNF7_9CHLO
MANGGTVAPQQNTRLNPHGMLQRWDLCASNWAYKTLGRQVPRDVWIGLEHSGNGLVWLPLVAGLLCMPQLSPLARHLVANFFLGFWTDLIIVGLLKGIVRRPRPSYNNPDDFLLVVAVDKWSFPSGHASRVAYMAGFACVIAAANGSHMGVATTVWGTVVALSRALLGRHYLGDICAGALVGILNTALITKGTFSATNLLVPAELTDHIYQEASRMCLGVMDRWT